MTGEELFWDLVEPMYADPAVSRSTMMGLPCVRYQGRFFAALDRRSDALLIKLPQPRVAQLVTDGDGEPFAPASRVFREWVAILRSPPTAGAPCWPRPGLSPRTHLLPVAGGGYPGYAVGAGGNDRGALSAWGGVLGECDDLPGDVGACLIDHEASRWIPKGRR
jgi:hypothetical protein